MNTNHFIEIYEDNINKADYSHQIPVERALLHALKEFREALPPLDDYFHKAFRQVDVLDSGHLDMLMWNLLTAATIFWQTWEELEADEKTAERS